MSPFQTQFNSTLFMMNALNSYSSSNAFSSYNYSMPSLFGGSFGSFGSFNTPSINVFGLLNSFNFSASSFQFPAFNFGTFGTNVRSNNGNNRRVSLTTNRAQNAVELAKSQIGVRENGSSNDSIDVRKYKNGARNSNAWCGSFVSWCYGSGQNSNNSDTFGFDESTQSIKNKAIRAGHYASVKSDYVPQVGDVAVWSYSSSTGHVGIVSKVYADGSFETIEGNCGNKVQSVRRTRNTENLNGFVKMNEWTAQA